MRFRIKYTQNAPPSLPVDVKVKGIKIQSINLSLRLSDPVVPVAAPHVEIGVAGEDSPACLDFFRSHKFSSRYIYLNSGPGVYGWRLNYTSPEYNTMQIGHRAIRYLEHCNELDMIPVFVYYNIPDSGESFYTNMQHIQDDAYMRLYFEDLDFLLGCIKRLRPDKLTRIILEPDFLGYMCQNNQGPDTKASLGLDFKGLVHRIQDSISEFPNIEYGWMVNLWTWPEYGPTGMGVVRGYSDYKDAIKFAEKCATNIFNYLKQLDLGGHFFAVDKYGLDFRALEQPLDKNPWAFNHDHWMVFLHFVHSLGKLFNKPAHLWQMPCGHLNQSQSDTVPLDNTIQKYEDSSATFFFGDSFTPKADELEHWGANKSGLIQVENGRVTWPGMLDRLNEYGVKVVMFGAGVGISTSLGGLVSGITDNGWFIRKYESRSRPE